MGDQRTIQEAFVTYAGVKSMLEKLWAKCGPDSTTQKHDMVIWGK